ncbi:MAG: Spy/CpxP family protein refolding chaperone [Bacteroidales bacterium]|nr:Spy/CpxP family protein refolding chaperone [Bacteroidales bacterium]
MKTQNRVLLKISLVTLLLGAFLWISAQPGPGRGAGWTDQCRMLPDLTEEQQVQLNDLRIAHLKEMAPLRNQLNEKKAHLQTLSTVENPDMKSINKTIDEMGSIKTQMMKNRAAHQQQVRNLLNDEQKLVFDSRKHGPDFRTYCDGYGRGKHQGRGQGNGPGNGQGYGRGFGPGNVN